MPLPQFLRQLPGAVWATDRDLRITYALGRLVDDSPALQRAVGTTVYEFLDSSDPSEPAIAHHLAALAGKAQAFRYPLRERCYEVKLEPLFDAGGCGIGCVGTAVDITERHTAEDRLARSEARLAAAQRLAHVGSFEWDMKSDTVTWSDELYRIFGIHPQEFAGTFEGFLSRVHPDDRASTQERIFGVLHEGGVLYEHRILRPDGSVRMLQTRAEAVRDERDVPIGIIGSCLDVTELRVATRRLEASISLLNATLEATADGILVIARDGQIVAHNGRFLALWGLPRSLVESVKDAELLSAVRGQLVDADEFERTVRELYENPPRESFDVLHFKDGRVFERYSGPQWVGEAILGRVWSFRDVTARETALREARDALRARDEFLSIVAHEIRSPITSIHLSVQTLRHRVTQPEALPKVLDLIEREDRRLARFVDELLDVGRIRGGHFHFLREDVDLAEIVRGVTTQLADELARAHSPVSVELEDEVRGQWDRFRLEEVVTNLLSNAAKFGDGKPIELTVATDADRRTAILRVRDSGVGIRQEMLDRIFLPFERAVSVRQFGGLGLGLYIVRTIIQGMGGTIRVESREGEGTTFTVELPMGTRS